MAIDSAWASRLQEATFAGLNFEVEDYDYEMDRRTVTHEFPFRDLPLIEDLGLGLQKISMGGYLVGDDVFDQRDAFMEATKTAGEAELVHPSLGSLMVTLTSASFAEATDTGRMIKLRLVFVVTNDAGGGDSFWQSITPDQPGFIQSAVNDVKDALHSDFVTTVVKDVKEGAAFVKGVVRQAQSYVGLVKNVIGDASRIVHSVDGLSNSLTGLTGSRYAHSASGSVLSSINGTLSGVTGAIGTASRISGGTTALISAANRGYSDVVKLGNTFSSLASKF